MSKQNYKSNGNRKPNPNKKPKAKPRHSTFRGKSNQTPMRPSENLHNVPKRLWNVPNRLTHTTVSQKESHSQFKKVETYMETDPVTGERKKHFKTTNSYPKVVKIDDEGTQKLFKVFCGMDDEIEDEEVNSDQMKLRMLSQICEDHAHFSMTRAQESALHKMSKVDGEVSIFKWKEKVEKAKMKLEILWHKKEELSNQQKFLLLKTIKMEERENRKHLKQVRRNDQSFVGHEELLQEVDDVFRDIITSLTDNFMEENEPNIMNDMQEDELENFFTEHNEDLGDNNIQVPNESNGNENFKNGSYENPDEERVYENSDEENNSDGSYEYSEAESHSNGSYDNSGHSNGSYDNSGHSNGGGEHKGYSSCKYCDDDEMNESGKLANYNETEPLFSEDDEEEPNKRADCKETFSPGKDENSDIDFSTFWDDDDMSRRSEKRKVMHSKKSEVKRNRISKKNADKKLNENDEKEHEFFFHEPTEELKDMELPQD